MKNCCFFTFSFNKTINFTWKLSRDVYVLHSRQFLPEKMKQLAQMFRYNREIVFTFGFRNRWLNETETLTEWKWNSKKELFKLTKKQKKPPPTNIANGNGLGAYSNNHSKQILTRTWSCSPAYSMLWNIVHVYRLRISMRAKYRRYHRWINMAAFIAKISRKQQKKERVSASGSE